MASAPSPPSRSRALTSSSTTTAAPDCASLRVKNLPCAALTPSSVTASESQPTSMTLVTLSWQAIIWTVLLEGETVSK